MLTTGQRPRELHWYHAGPMLFGDWGTSRLYVLGLAYAFTGRASFWFIGAMCVLMIGVGWSYAVVCRLFPDGGGVYSSARQRSQLLAVIGALLLCADYVVTASLSCLDAFHYLGLDQWSLPGGLGVDAVGAAITILLVGALNFFGPRKSGTIAMVIAMLTIVLTLVIAVMSIPHLGTARITSPFARGPAEAWIGLTEIVLALSGVEAIANMTGIMVQPVERTARRSIIPVLCEIVILNMILAAAMSALPDSVLNERSVEDPSRLAHTGDMLKIIAAEFVHPAFATASSVVFAALLLSAGNTAISALVSIQYMLSRDRELPRVFSGLNRYGMPAAPLVVASIVPAVVLLLFPQVERLADLYAIGVVGAILINLASAATNPALSMRPSERWLMWVLTVVLAAIELTICVVKPHARCFALIVLVIGLAARLVTIAINKTAPLPDGVRRSYLTFSIALVAVVLGFTVGLGDEHLATSLVAAGAAVGLGYASFQTHRYRHAIVAAEAEAAGHPPRMIQEGSYKPKERIMVATQGNPRLLAFALEECKRRQAELQLLFIRHQAFTPMGPIQPPNLQEDEQAKRLFEEVRKVALEQGVPLRLLYSVATNIPEAILDMAVTHGADLLLLGTTRRGALWKAMKGDVIQGVAEHLPERVGLLIHA
jgi:amino acid transporter/nucleotide-binding universal stress UspA family protein